MITIKEMANMLGVSTTTVSNVIHNKTGEMSPETVKRVKKVLQEYEYVPNISARNLASNKSGIIGVAIISDRKGPVNYLKDAFISELLGCIEEELRSSGYYLMMCFSSDANELIQTVLSWNVDGLIMFGIKQDVYDILQKRLTIPQVYIDSYIDDICLNAVNIGLDDRGGGYLAGRYLVERGHRRIGFVCDDHVGCDYERYCGMVTALSREGISLDSDNFIELNAAECSIEECCESVYRRMHDFTALFCASDYYAMHIMNYMTDRGVKVPEDISIMGFDDNIYAQMVRPALTTVRQSPSEKGRLAVRYLLKQLETDEKMSNWIVLPVELVERDTVKNIA